MASSAEEIAQALTGASTTEAIYRALVQIRTKLIKQPQGIDILCKSGGFEHLLEYVSRPNMKILDISLSILGNCCLDPEARKKVKSLNGISPIVTVLKGLEMGSIQNRACRTLANLALDKEIASSLHTAEAVPVIVSFLKSTRDPLNQQTAIRALRLLADTQGHRDEVIRHDGLAIIAELLSTKDTEVLKCALKAMSHLTENCTRDCAEQMYPGRYLQYLVTLSNHKVVAIREMAVVTLVNLAHDKFIRPYLGNAGAVRVFIKETIGYDEGTDMPCGDSPVYALCMCSIESVNRRRIRNYKGLGAMMKVLKKENQSLLQEKILEAFMNFIWDSEYLKELQSLGIISIIVEKLHCYLKSELASRTMIKGLPKWQIRKKDAQPLEQVSQTVATDLPEEKEPDPEIQDYPGELEWTEKPFWRLSTCHSSYTSEMKRQRQCENKQQYFYYYNEEEWKNSFQFKYPIPDFANDQRLLHKHGKFFPYVYVPEWLATERYPPISRWEEDFFHRRMFYDHRSPRSLSPMSISSSASTPCYSPCEFSEEEDGGMESESDKDKKLEEENWRNMIINDDKELDKEKSDTIMEASEQLAHYKFSSDRFPTLSTNFWWLEKNQNPYISHILTILKRCAQPDKPSLQLLSSSCIEALLTCLSLHEFREDVEKILLALVGSKLCLESLVLMRFPDQLNLLALGKSTLGDDIWSLSHKVLNKMADQCHTVFGQGEIERIITVGEPDDKISALLMIPFLETRHDSMLKKFFLEKDGLGTMMNLLSDQHGEHFDIALRSCAKILDILAFTGPTPGNSSDVEPYLTDVTNPCVFKTDSQAKDVKFVLDSGDTVKGNRTILSQNCEVFNVMLQGSFSEAASDVIRFGEASSFSLNYVVHFLHGCNLVYSRLDYETRKMFEKSAECPLFSNNVDNLFEVFLLSDRLLLQDVQSQVYKKILRLLEKIDMAEEVYTLALSHRLEHLAKTAFEHVARYFYYSDQIRFVRFMLVGSDPKFGLSLLNETINMKITCYEPVKRTRR